MIDLQVYGDDDVRNMRTPEVASKEYFEYVTNFYRDFVAISPRFAGAWPWLQPLIKEQKRPSNLDFLL